MSACSPRSGTVLELASAPIGSDDSGKSLIARARADPDDLATRVG